MKSEVCGALVCWDNGWWPVYHPCVKPPHDGGSHIAEFRSVGGVPMCAILHPGQRYADVYVDTIALNAIALAHREEKKRERRLGRR